MKKLNFRIGNDFIPFDTLYFSVWGNPYVYVDRPTYRSLTDEQRKKVISDGFRLGDSCRIFGQIVFVKSDSVIVTTNEDYSKDKLFFKKVSEL